MRVLSCVLDFDIHSDPGLTHSSLYPASQPLTKPNRELKEGQGRREAEAGERMRVEGEARALGEEVKALREQLSGKTEELAAARLEATQVH